jgi:chromosome condensin MukBEF MukE localization factor
VDGDRCAERAEALYEVIGAGEMTVATLTAAVADHPAWQGFGDREKLHEKVRDRLNAMRTKGRIVDRHEQNGRLRFVRRAPSPAGT